MAYLTNSTPPQMAQQNISEQTNRMWSMSGTDPVATVRVTGYISDGGKYGMKVGDLVRYLNTNLNIVSTLVVESVSSTYPGAVDLGDATTIGSTTNSD